MKRAFQPMQSRRAILYVPGDDPRKIGKAASLKVDCVCLDLEDGVAYNRKEQARSTILESLQTLEFTALEKMVRINPAGSGLESEDLHIAVLARPQVIVIPKVEEPAAVEWASQSIAQLEAELGLASGGIGLLAAIESARGLVNLAGIARASDRLQALIFGAEDYASSIGAMRTPQSWEVLYARSALLAHAAANDLQAIDMVYVDFRDLSGLVQEARLGAQLGFTGKQVIHPDQVDPVQDAFTPDQAAIEQALRLIQAFEAHQSAGKGVFSLEGKMVEAPMIRAAQRILVKARAAGRL